jgi:energy-converting hydrogenase A subunit M
MTTMIRPRVENSAVHSLAGLHSKIREAKMAIDEELGRATDMDFRLKLLLTVNSLRNLEEQILRRA